MTIALHVSNKRDRDRTRRFSSLGEKETVFNTVDPTERKQSEQGRGRKRAQAALCEKRVTRNTERYRGGTEIERAFFLVALDEAGSCECGEDGAISRGADIRRSNMGAIRTRDYFTRETENDVGTNGE